MSTYIPSSGLSLSSQDGASADRALALRVRLISQRNPWMASRPDVLQSMASSSYDTDTLLSVSGQMFGMQAGDSMKGILERMSAPAQRAVLAGLSDAQRASLAQLGYEEPRSENQSDGWLGEIMKAAAVPLGIVGKGISAINEVPLLGDVTSGTLHALTWVGNLPGQAYRTIRQLDDAGQWGGLVGAIGGLAAVALAVPTGGASLGLMGTLTAAGALGLGATAGATLGSLATQITNPGDWFRAWGDAQDGERVFDRPSKRRVAEILADPRLHGLAQDIAAIPGFSIVRLAEEMAGQHDANLSSQLAAVEKLAGELGTRGTAAFDHAAQTMFSALQDTAFQEAVQTLVRGKISVGRDLADVVGLDPGSNLYNLVSGATDALFTVAVDPTLLLGGANKLYRAQRYGLKVAEGSTMVQAFRDLAELPGIRRAHEAVAAAVQSESLAKLTATSREFEPIYDDLLTFKEQLKTYGRDFAKKPFGREDVVDYIAGQANLKPVMEGVGSVATNKGWVLQPISAPRAAVRSFRSAARQFTYGLGDVRLTRELAKLAERNGHDLADILPMSTHGAVSEAGVIDHPWKFTSPNPTAYRVGQMLGEVPVVGRTFSKIGDVMVSMTTMSITGKALHVTGREAPKQVRAMAELGRYMGMPSWARQAWTDSILDATSTSARVQAVHGWLANMIKLTGVEGTPEGAKLISEYLEASKKLYGQGDEIVVNGYRMHAGILLGDQADMVVMPDLRELRKATTTSHIAKHVMGIVDAPILQTALNKVWKPMVLLRIGFIPRAAGEELTAFLLRGGIGSLTQEAGARFIGRADALRQVLDRRALDPLSKLTKAEEQILAQGRYFALPNHVKPVYRMMRRLGYDDPALQKLYRYGDWLREWARDGLTRIDPLDRRLLNARKAVGDAAAASPAVANASRWASALFLGNPYSVRRMILGGVDDELVDAAAAWWRSHSTTVMREASAINAGPVQPQLDQRNVRQRLEIDPQTDELRPVMVFTERGRRYHAADDDAVRHGVLEKIQRMTTDPVLGQVARDYLSRVKGGAKVDEAMLDTMIRDWWGLGRKANDTGLVVDNAAATSARSILLELAGGAHRDEMWQALLTRLRRRKETVPVARVLELHPRAAVPTKQSIIDTFDAVLHDLRGDASLADLQLLSDVRDALAGETVIDKLARMDPATREFVAQWLHGQVVGGNESWYAQFLQRQWPARRPSGMTRAQRHVLDTFAGELPTKLRKMDVTALEQTVRQLRVSGGLWRADAFALERMEEALTQLRAGGWPLTDAQQAEVISRAAGVRGVLDRRHPLAPRPDERWLYDGLGDAVPEMVSATRGHLLDPAMNPEGVPKSLRTLTLDPKSGELVLDPTLRDANALLWEAPPLRNVPYAELRAASRNPAILDENEAAVLQVLATPGNQVALVANQRLAEELHRIAADRAGVAIADTPRHYLAPRDVAEGRAYKTLQPVQGNTERTVTWRLPDSVAQAKLRPTPDAAIDPVQEWAQVMVNNAVDWSKRGNRFGLRPIVDNKDGVLVPRVYRYEYGELTAVPPGQEITPDMAPVLMNHKGEKIVLGDTYYFERADTPVSLAAQGVMWEALGPALRDSFDDRFGNIIFRQKDLSVEGAAKGTLVQSPDIVASQRSVLDDVARISSDDLPSYAIKELESNRKIGTWDKVVQFGFDRVIGPAIDAVARRPMAFHAFAQRYMANMRNMKWLVDPDVERKVLDLAANYHAGASFDLDALERNVRQLATLDGAKAAEWTRKQTFAWLRGHSVSELSDTLARARVAATQLTGAAATAADVALRQLGRVDLAAARAAAVDAASMSDFVKAVEAEFAVPGALNSLDALANPARAKDIADSPLLAWIEQNDAWEALVAAKANLTHLERTAAEAAATGAIADVVPFIDSHEFKTQFADYGKGMMPFWYAEENFLKRWARGLSEEGLPLIRKAQLTYMGMKHAGIIRTDESGRDWFVYPGSGLLAEAIGKALPGMDALPVGMMFQTPTDQMLPGLNNRFGTPSFNPLVTVPMDVVSWLLPETQPVERAILGDFVSTRMIVDQVIPAHLRNIFYALTGDEETNTRYASAMTSAIAYMEAHGNGLPDDATPGQRDEFLRRVRDHARVIVLAQALAGFTSPGSPQLTEAEPGVSWTGIGLTDAADVFATEYLRLVRMFGVEDGTAKFLELRPDAGLKDVVNPIAYTVPRNESRSGAPLPSTEEALTFYDDHRDYFDAMPYAAPWLIPPSSGDARSQYAYDQMTIGGLRDRRTPQEFLEAMKFKEASGPYFAKRDGYLAQIAKAQGQGNRKLASQLKQQMETDLLLFRTAHPVFDEQLRSPDSRDRRKKVIDEMRYVVNDPLAPPSPMLAPLTQVIDLWDEYSSQLAVLSSLRTSAARAQVERLKVGFGETMNRLARENPGIMSFWLSVLRPEAGLD